MIDTIHLRTLLTGILLVAGLSAQQPQNETRAEPSAAAEPKSFAPPAPTYDPDWDWVKLTSGEWLKGDIKSIYDDVMEFDSDNLGLLTIDTEDIEELLSSSTMRVNVGNRQPLVGRVVLDQDELTLVNENAEVRTVPRSRVVSITAGSPKEVDLWTAKVSLGANLRSGNTDQVEYNSRVQVQRRAPLTRFSFDYLGNISTTNDVETANNHRATSFLDYYFDRRWFFRVTNLEYFRDIFQNTEHRVTAATALGYTVIDTSKLEWDVIAGPGYQYTEFTGDSSSSSTGSAIGFFRTAFDLEINKYQDLNGGYDLTWTEAGSGGLLHHLILTLENEVTDDFDIDISFIWDRISNPAENANGTSPEPDDFRLIFGVGYEL